MPQVQPSERDSAPADCETIAGRGVEFDVLGVAARCGVELLVPPVFDASETAALDGLLRDGCGWLLREMAADDGLLGGCGWLPAPPPPPTVAAPAVDGLDGAVMAWRSTAWIIGSVTGWRFACGCADGCGCVGMAGRTPLPPLAAIVAALASACDVTGGRQLLAAGAAASSRWNSPDIEFMPLSRYCRNPGLPAVGGAAPPPFATDVAALARSGDVAGACQFAASGWVPPALAT